MAVLVRVLFILVAGFGSLLSALAFLGVASPYLDVLNHLQIPLFLGTLVALLLTPLLLPEDRVRALLLAVVATGFVASSAAVVPEALSSLAPRPPVPTDGRPVVKLMTHNLFGLNDDMEQVARVIGRENPDIVAFLEYFPEQSSELEPLLAPSYPHSVHCFGGKRANIALYSKWPFEQTMDGACSSDPRAGARTARIIARFTMAGGRQFSVVTTHLDWPVPVERKEEQFAVLAQSMAGVSGPAMLVGDLNSTPWSYSLRRFAVASGLERQTRNLMSFPVLFYYLGEWRPTLPLLPLDHVFTKNGVVVHDVHTAAATGSDHLPVVVTFSLARTNR